MADDALHELTAAYALDALDPDEERAYEEHLARCEQCREELTGFREAAGALALAVDPTSPPPALRGRILDAARAERSNVVTLDWFVIAIGSFEKGIRVWHAMHHRADEKQTINHFRMLDCKVDRQRAAG